MKDPGVLTNEEGRLQLTKTLLKILSKEFESETNVGSLSNKLTDAIPNYLSQSSKYYQKLKRKNNQLAKKLLGPAKNYIKKGTTPRQKFERACHLASASNVAPMNAPFEAFAFQEVKSILRGRKPFPAMMGPLFQEARKASNVLYIIDNAGEIGFDSLLMAYLKEMGLKIHLVVKEDPFFEDATMEDALFFSIDQLVDHMFTLNGFFVPKEIPPALTDLYKKMRPHHIERDWKLRGPEGRGEGKNCNLYAENEMQADRDGNRSRYRKLCREARKMT